MNDAELIRPIQIVNEATLKAKHAIRKALEVGRDFEKAHGSSVVESQSEDLQAFVLHLADHAARGYKKL